MNQETKICKKCGEEKPVSEGREMNSIISAEDFLVANIDKTRDVAQLMVQYANYILMNKERSCMYCEKKLKPGEAIIVCEECIQ